MDAEFLRLGAFHADVSARGRVFSDADEGDAGDDAVPLLEGLGAGLGFGMDLGGDRFAVDDSGAGHGFNPRARFQIGQGRNPFYLSKIPF